MLGTENEAATFLRALKTARLASEWGYADTDHLGDALPMGWEIVGEGGTRITALAPSGVVYKGNMHFDNREGMQQHAEWSFYLRNRAAFPVGNVDIPEMHLWELEEPILACEWVKGTPIESSLYVYVSAEVIARFEEMRLFDLAYDNVLSCGDNKYMIVDLGVSQ